ncbi:hypothetical protein HPP92_003381 [Vanilla planifolia]|uniref:Pentatricopeptide repeat-containing protein n=1 Tax=Vanilla planifolia TaxID=51239 RepID=A0A835S803_VANPL|nr:hypothetical protein HPP92_003381 [Vanilla planifolia]
MPVHFSSHFSAKHFTGLTSLLPTIASSRLCISRSSTAASWFSILHAASISGDLRLVLKSHARIVTSGTADRVVTNNLISAYSRCGSITSAVQLFGKAPCRDSVTWNSLISAYALHGFVAEGLAVFNQMLCLSVPPTHLTFSPLLKLCSGSRDLTRMLQSIHCYANKIGWDTDELVSSALVGAYSKVGFMDDAKYLFERMADKDVVLWNVLIKGYAQMGLAQDSFLMFCRLHRCGIIRPDAISVHCVLMGMESGKRSEQVFSYGIKSCLVEDLSDVVTWNKTMSDLAKAGDDGAALSCFSEMRRLGVEYDHVTLVIVISVITSLGCYKLGRQFHSVAIKGGLYSDVSVSNNLINLYSNMGSFPCARNVFDEIEELDLISWNSLIYASIQNGLPEVSITLFINMSNIGMLPDHFTLTNILRACSGLIIIESLHKQVHATATKSSLVDDIFVLTALVDVYVKKGCIVEAESLFNDMDSFDITCFNALLAGYIRSNENQKALNMVATLHISDEKFNHYTLATILKACSSLVEIEQGTQLHTYAIKLGYDSDLCVSSGLVDMYIKCGYVRDAFVTFKDISEPDNVAWTAMISGCVENGDEDHAIDLYRQMRYSGLYPDEFTVASVVEACFCFAAMGQGKQIHAEAIKFNFASDTFVSTAIMDMYAKCGSIEDSFFLFERTDSKSLASWNAMILGFAQHGKGKAALDLFKQMELDGKKPDKITFLGVLSACSHAGLVSEAYNYFKSMSIYYNIEPEVEHYSCLVDGLGRAGLLGEAEEVLKKMPFQPTASMLRALLGACCIKGNNEIGRRVATSLLELDTTDSSAYVVLSNMYAAAKKWDEVHASRKSMEDRNVKKDPGYSWIEVKNKVHLFVANDNSHPESAHLHEELDDLKQSLRNEGYVRDTEFMLLDFEVEEKKQSLCCNSG